MNKTTMCSKKKTMETYINSTHLFFRLFSLPIFFCFIFPFFSFPPFLSPFSSPFLISHLCCPFMSRWIFSVPLQHFSLVNIFHWWIFFIGEYFSLANIFHWRIFFIGEYFHWRIFFIGEYFQCHCNTFHWFVMISFLIAFPVHWLQKLNDSLFLFRTVKITIYL